MKKLIYILIAMPLLFAACSNDDLVPQEETVQVNFCAKMSQQIGTRANTATLTVDKVYCAVFENGVEHKSLRGEIDIVPGEDIVFSSRLIKDRTYRVAFWACKERAYDVKDMTNITRIASTSSNPLSEEDYDAFTYSTVEFTVGGNYSENIILTRPLAQLNIGITEQDWNTVADPQTFNMTPGTLVINIKGCNTFNALSQTAGNEADLTYSLPCDGELFTVYTDNGDVPYKRLGMCYVMSNTTKSTPPMTYTVNDTGNNVICSNVTIPFITLENNHRTYVIGSLLTSSANYSISCNEWSDKDDETLINH